MKALWLTMPWGLVFLSLLTAAPAESQMEVRIAQASLETVAARWTSGDAAEGRWWWSPVRGGSGWVRVGDWQAGGVTAATVRAERTWSAGEERLPGPWGLVYDGPWGGLWGVQDSRRFEAGGQLKGRSEPWRASLGWDRRWSLVEPALPPLDRSRAGLSWSVPELSWGAETSAEHGRGLPTSWRAAGKTQWSPGPWTWEGGGGWNSASGLDAALNGGWERGGWAFTAGWDRRRGTTAGYRSKTSLADWQLATGAQIRRADARWSGDLRTSVSGSAGDAVWSFGWVGRPRSSSLVQETEAIWREGPLELEARWRVESLSLGWYGPDARFRLILRWKL